MMTPIPKDMVIKSIVRVVFVLGMVLRLWSLGVLSVAQAGPVRHT